MMSVMLGQLRGLLSELGFQSTKQSPAWVIHRHEQTLILLPSGDDTLPVRPSDLVTARKLLVENGYLSEDEFDGRLDLQLIPSADA